MIYLVRACIEEINGTLVSVCGGDCCHNADYSRFGEPGWILQTCSYLHNGLCSCHQDRPEACIGFPFFDCSPSDYPPNQFLTPWCFYRHEVLDFYQIPYRLLDSGKECFEKYREGGLGDFTQWTLKWYRKRTVFMRSKQIRS